MEPGLKISSTKQKTNWVVWGALLDVGADPYQREEKLKWLGLYGGTVS